MSGRGVAGRVLTEKNSHAKFFSHFPVSIFLPLYRSLSCPPFPNPHFYSGSCFFGGPIFLPFFLSFPPLSFPRISPLFISHLFFFPLPLFPHHFIYRRSLPLHSTSKRGSGGITPGEILEIAHVRTRVLAYFWLINVVFSQMRFV